MINAAASGSIDAEVVLQRTRAGQREAVFAETLTSSAARRLLLIVNGITPLGRLLAMDGGSSDPLQVTRSLVDAGLLERVER